MREAVVSFFRNMRRPRMERRLPALFASVFMMGVCVAVLDKIDMGTDPCTVLNLGLSDTLGVPFGTFQLAINTLMLMIVLRFDLSRIGAGTLANMAGVGYVAEFFMWLLNQPAALQNLSLAARCVIFVPTMLVFLVAVSFYVAVDMGVAPYDALPQIIAGRCPRVSFRAVRMAWDIAALAIGWLLGSTVGIATVITGFFLGPMIAYVSKKVEPFFN